MILLEESPSMMCRILPIFSLSRLLKRFDLFFEIVVFVQLSTKLNWGPSDSD